MDEKELIRLLKEKRKFYLELSKQAEGFAFGYSSGLNEVINMLSQTINLDQVDPEEEKSTALL